MENTLNDIQLLFDRGVFKNEQHIRVAVVCRILQELGWNIWNPEEVNLEFTCTPDEDSTKVDVALMSAPSRLDVVAEVKGYGLIRGKLADFLRWFLFQSQKAGRFDAVVGNTLSGLFADRESFQILLV